MDDCSLPCWNNLEPGKSDADEIFRFFSNMGIAIELPIIEPDDNSDLFGAGGDFMPGVNSISLDLVEVIWTEKVESIQISYFRNLDFDNKDNFLHPKNLIPTIGFPKTVSMYVQQNSYYIYIGFPDLNAGIVYQGYLSEYLTSPKLCLSRNESVGVMIRLYADTFEYIPPIGMINDYEDLASPETFTPYDEKTFLSVISDRSRCVPLQFDE